MRKWLLPEAVDDVLPAEAARVEALRRALLDHFRARGYRLVQPPLVEYLDSLLTGTGRDLDLLTFKTVDPPSGRMLGRARRHDAPGGADRRASAERDRRHAPVLRGQRAAHVRVDARRHARSRADRRRALRPRRHRRRCRSDAAAGIGARRGRHPRPAPRPRPRRHLSRTRARRRASTRAAKATMPNSSRRCATRTCRPCRN